MKFIDFFSGAGMFRKGMELAGHICNGFVEIDKFARQTYEANYHCIGVWSGKDICEVKAEDIPSAEIWCAGSPCKNLSVANKKTRDGLDGNQSGLFWVLCDLLEGVAAKPQYVFIENVDGFTSIKNGLDFLEAVYRLDELGYDITYEVSSATQYGVPQNRVRTYLVCKLREVNNRDRDELFLFNKEILVEGYNIRQLYDFIIRDGNKVKLRWYAQEYADAISGTASFKTRGKIINGICSFDNFEGVKECNSTLKDILEDIVDNKYYLNDKQLEKVTFLKGRKQKELKNGGTWKEGAVPFPDSLDKYSRCVTPADGSINRSTICVNDGKGYRKLTIRERARLQGLPDTFKFPVSDNQASLQLGNGVAVEVIRAIAEREIK